LSNADDSPISLAFMEKPCVKDADVSQSTSASSHFCPHATNQPDTISYHFGFWIGDSGLGKLLAAMVSVCELLHPLLKSVEIGIKNGS
jgi:hypothetical protein